jgi:hypothetical protein
LKKQISWVNKEQPEVSWELQGRSLTLVHKNKRYPVKQFNLIANGTRDLYMVKNRDGDLDIRAKPNLEETDEEIYQFKDDVILVEFFKLSPLGTKYLYFEMDDKTVPMVEQLLINASPDKRSKYDAFIGRNYKNIT